MHIHVITGDGEPVDAVYALGQIVHVWREAGHRVSSGLVDVLDACAHGRLAEIDLAWKPGAAACVVMASEGYPGAYPKGRPISGLDGSVEDAYVFHAGTTEREGQVVTAGGRVLAVSGWGSDIAAALARAYAAVSGVSFDGAHFRRDIGWRALKADEPRRTNDEG